MRTNEIIRVWNLSVIPYFTFTSINFTLNQTTVTLLVARENVQWLDEVECATGIVSGAKKNTEDSLLSCCSFLSSNKGTIWTELMNDLFAQKHGTVTRC